MPSYDFEVWQGDRPLHSMKGVELERPAHGWDRVGRLAARFNEPGCHIAVKDESGDLTILVGARTARCMLSQEPRNCNEHGGEADPKVSPPLNTSLVRSREVKPCLSIHSSCLH
jgi:hypothetical protein